MKLNQIIISGDTNQDLRTPEENESFFKLGKSIQVFFREKLTHQFRELIAPLLDEIDRSYEAELEANNIQIAYEEQAVPQKAEIKKKEGPRIFRKAISRPEDDDFLKGFWERIEQERVLELEKLKQFDRQTYENLYKENFPWIARSIMEQGGNKQIARDIFQSALIILLERLKSKEFILTCNAGTYLNSVAVNIWRNLRRKLAERVIHIEILDIDYTSMEAIYFEEIPEDYEKVAAILEQMGDPCKSLLENFYFNQLSWEAIAEKMGYANAASARNQKYKCLEKIREIMSA